MDFALLPGLRRKPPGGGDSRKPLPTPCASAERMPEAAATSSADSASVIVAWMSKRKGLRLAQHFVRCILNEVCG